jgi:nucleoside-diphosphate-sugar epimerase
MDIAALDHMRIFVAGGTGAVGRQLVPMLVEEGHEVIALARDAQRAHAVHAMGARVAIADALDQEALTAAIRRSQPEVIIHQLTALARAGNLRRMDGEFRTTNRFRTVVTDTMLGAARVVGTRRFIAQSFCGWPFAREGGPVKSEDDPLDPDPPRAFSQTHAAIRYLEDSVRQTHDLEALALRYGIFYGPGTAIALDGLIVGLLRKRLMPIVGDGAGIWSFIHVADVARATAAAVSDGPPGIYNIVDDEPAPVSEWLPALAEAVRAKPPRRVPTWLGRLALGDGGVSMMTRIRGASNAKAKSALRWRPFFESWRRGFVEGLDWWPESAPRRQRS